MRDISSDDYEPKRRSGCQCRHMDMPGSCPGPRNCPMVSQPTCPKCGEETGHNSEYTYGGDLIASQQVCLECGWEGEPA